MIPFTGEKNRLRWSQSLFPRCEIIDMKGTIRLSFSRSSWRGSVTRSEYCSSCCRNRRKGWIRRRHIRIRHYCCCSMQEGSGSRSRNHIRRRRNRRYCCCIRSELLINRSCFCASKCWLWFILCGRGVCVTVKWKENRKKLFLFFDFFTIILM